MKQQTEHNPSIPLPPAGPIGRYASQTLYMLFITLPLSIISFVLSVTLTALGFGLTPLLIGLPILKMSVHLSHALMMADARRIRMLLPEKYAAALPYQHAFGPFSYKDLFTSTAPYFPLTYWLVKLPASVLQFAAAVTFPLVGTAALLSPVVYLVLKQYDIEIYQDDVVFNTIFPMLSPLERSYVGSGVGLLFLLIGWSVLSRLTHVQANRTAMLLEANPQRPAAAKAPIVPAVQQEVPADALYQAAAASAQPPYSDTAKSEADYSLDSLPFEPFDPDAPAPASATTRYSSNNNDDLKAELDALRQQLHSKMYPPQ
ncbi:putative sensor protein [Paenibacillus cellulosilyticus]|uniref:Putative sensor protein n=1 Tax=Paenibacillus cellulosilyticus TaxID=375489 RepID=A0A2V2YZG3_9BACL|nr:sensor domain-containing protein [Paenibacillus cellulosilyticus]PWW05254.1 putative sensor protein [Paenibacillus cellulosilyticus]QKS43578.1 sensor domain-containing protein [Paenibacillus cellulosilyticus]